MAHFGRKRPRPGLVGSFVIKDFGDEEGEMGSKEKDKSCGDVS